MITYRGFLDRDYFSRYSKDRVIDDSVDLYFEYDSYIDLSSLRYNYYTITSADVNRLTIIAMKFYDNPLYWWIIAKMNDISDPFYTPPVGTQLKIPYRDDVTRLYNKVIGS